MKIGIFGTGIVGQTLAGALAAKGVRLYAALGSPMFNFKIVR